MSFDSSVTDAAAAALGADLPVEPAAPSGPAPEQAQAPQTEVAPAPVADTLDFDLSPLPEETQQRIREGFLRQADYTRKTQELAPFRQAVEEFGGYDEARAALDFTQRLNSDPLFAQHIYGEIGTQLTQMGFLGQDGATQVDPNEFDPGESEFGELPPQIKEKLAQVDQLQQRLDQQDYERVANQAQIELATALRKQELLVLDAQPDYKEEDMASVYRLAHSFGGDLWQAHQHYEADSQRIINNFLAKKASVPAGSAQMPPSSASAEGMPTRFTDTNDPRLKQAAAEMLHAAIAANE